jgi:hypothetical protein
MRKKEIGKPYWDMTTDELREATKQFDEEFVGDKARPLTPEERAIWERAKAKGEPSLQTISIRIEKSLLKRCAAV